VTDRGGRVVLVRLWDSEEEDGECEQGGADQSVCLICSVPRIVVKKGQLVERRYGPGAR
jgi:hypothetical protein